MSFGDLRSTEDFDGTDLGERSMERREFCKGDGESVSDFTIPLPNLGILGVAGDTLLLLTLDALLI